MSFLRNLLADLVEKRLWPVAVLLVGALVAVPVLLGGGDAGSGDVAVAPAAPADTSGARAVRVSEDGEVLTVAPTGAKRNPFTQPVAKKAAAETDAAPATTNEPQAPASGGSAGGATTDATPTAPSTGGTTTTPSTPSTPQPDEDTNVLRVDLRFGEPGATKQKAYDDVARLSALPSTNEPVVIFLGLKKDKKTATFLISSDATATGDGDCKPSATNCQTIEMRQGDSTFLDIDLGSGVRQFRLDVKKIEEAEAEDAAKATQARARMSKAGQEYLRSAIESGEVELEGLDFDEGTGTLTSTPRAKTAGPVTRGAYRVDVQVGGTTRTDVSRLQLLPQRSTAKLLFLGVRDRGRSVSFLNLKDLPVQGATCKPSKDDCERITLRKGTTATVGGVPVRVAHLALRTFPTAEAAQAVRDREDEAGRALVTGEELQLGDLALSPLTGTLTRSPL
jgi:hypothetical protein